MSYPKISNQDWERLRELAAEYANYSGEGNEVDQNICRTRILDYLNTLVLQYGPHPQLYDTIADYLPEEEDPLPWRLKAYELCSESDHLELIMICKSIAEYYMTDKNNRTEAHSWASKALGSAHNISSAKEIAEIIELIKEIEAH
jgi:hypothetical protein